MSGSGCGRCSAPCNQQAHNPGKEPKMNSHTDAELIELVNSRPELLRWASDRGELNYALVICRECSGRSSLILLPVADVPDHVEWHDGVDKLVERGEAIERGEGFSL